MTSTDELIVPLVLKMLEADQCSRALGIVVRSAREGRALATATVAEEFTNGHRIAHGGLIFALADTALACAANSLVPGTVTAESSIIFLAPAHAGEELVAEATVRSTTGRHTVIDVTVRSADRVVAEFRGRGTARNRS